MSLAEFRPVDEQLQVIRRGVADIIVEAELAQKLERSRHSGTPLRVKLGLDPTAPDLHLGHTVVLRKLRDFQDLGHQIIVIIGDFTGMIGDPTGRSETRKALTRDEILSNAETYRAQLGKVIDMSRTRVEFNSTWLAPLTFEDIIRETASLTVARMLQREDFAARYAAERPISLHEFLYPIAQAYDSVALHADVEMGGTDQTFNLLVGRDLQRAHRQEPQIALTVPLLEGLDGVQKMSKSYGNYVGINEKADDIFGKLMSVSDAMMWRYFELLTEFRNLRSPRSAPGIRWRPRSGSPAPSPRSTTAIVAPSKRKNILRVSISTATFPTRSRPPACRRSEPTRRVYRPKVRRGPCGSCSRKPASCPRRPKRGA